MENVYLGRQSILTPDFKIYGYELFFRDKKFDYKSNFSNVSIEETARVIMNILTYIDFNEVVGDKKGFIKVSPEILEGEFIDILPAEKTVFQISGITAVTKYLISTCDSLRDKGYEIAVHVDRDYERVLPLLDSVDYIKIDITNFDDKELKTVTDVLKEFLNAKLVADKVENEKDFLFAKELGFDLFQGHFFEEPALYSGKKLPSFKVSLMTLLRYAMKEESFKKIEEFLQRQLGKPYDWLGILGFPLRNWKLERKNRWFCSELVFTAFKQAGVELLKNTHPSEVSPRLFLKSPLLHFEYSTKQPKFKQSQS